MKTDNQPDGSGGLVFRGDECAELLWWDRDPDRRKIDLLLALGKRAASSCRVVCFSDSELRGIAWSACVNNDTEFGRWCRDQINLNVEGINVHNAFWRAWAKDKASVNKLVSKIASPGEFKATVEMISQPPPTVGDDGFEHKAKARQRLLDKLKPPPKFIAALKRVKGQN